MFQVGDTKILGKTRFEAPPLEFQSPGDLVGSLRELKPEGSVLSDRFLSLQKRNVVEPTLKRNMRRAKTKRFVKPSHKMGWESKGFWIPIYTSTYIINCSNHFCLKEPQRDSEAIVMLLVPLPKQTWKICSVPCLYYQNFLQWVEQKNGFPISFCYSFNS